MGLRDLLLARSREKKKVVSVPTPEWAPETPEVFVRMLSGHEIDAYSVACVEIHGDQIEVRREDTTARLCLFTMCDADGKRLWMEDDLDDVARIDGPILKRIHNAAAELNRVRALDREPLKNDSSPEESSGSSGTGSPPTTDSSSGNSSTSATPPS
jgi:hypothetical protein